MARRLLPAAMACAGYATLVRPRMINYGATDVEILRPYPGAGLIPGARRTGTMATTIDAPPAEVWPWLVQMGLERAGWYSWDRLDNWGHSSAARIDPDWQRIAIGDRLYSRPDGTAWFEVAALDPGRFLGLRAALDLRGHSFDPQGEHPRFFSDSLWGFLLEELPGARTRLINGGYSAASPRAPLAAADALFWEPAHWVMQTRQWNGLKRRVRDAIDGGPVEASGPVQEPAAR